MSVLSALFAFALGCLCCFIFFLVENRNLLFLLSPLPFLVFFFQASSPAVLLRDTAATTKMRQQEEDSTKGKKTPKSQAATRLHFFFFSVDDVAVRLKEKNYLLLLEC